MIAWASWVSALVGTGSAALVSGTMGMGASSGGVLTKSGASGTSSSSLSGSASRSVISPKSESMTDKRSLERCKNGVEERGFSSTEKLQNSAEVLPGRLGIGCDGGLGGGESESGTSVHNCERVRTIFGAIYKTCDCQGVCNTVRNVGHDDERM